jgi:hypothetical protein
MEIDAGANGREDGIDEGRTPGEAVAAVTSLPDGTGRSYERR